VSNTGTVEERFVFIPNECSFLKKTHLLLRPEKKVGHHRLERILRRYDPGERKFIPVSVPITTVTRDRIFVADYTPNS
jgi:hypothetical protein